MKNKIFIFVSTVLVTSLFLAGCSMSRSSVFNSSEDSAISSKPVPNPESGTTGTNLSASLQAQSSSSEETQKAVQKVEQAKSDRQAVSTTTTEIDSSLQEINNTQRSNEQPSNQDLGF